MTNCTYPKCQATNGCIEVCSKEPVAWRYETGTFWDRTPHWRFLESAEQTKGLRTAQALYTAPPRREWVGLTEHMKIKLADRFHISMDAVEAIEAKLKEKNS